MTTQTSQQLRWISDGKTNGAVFTWAESELRKLAPLAIEAYQRQMRDRFPLSHEEVEHRRAHNDWLKTPSAIVRKEILLRISLNIQNPMLDAYTSRGEDCDDAYQVVMFDTVESTLRRDNDYDADLRDATIAVLPEVWSEIGREIDELVANLPRAYSE